MFIANIHMKAIRHRATRSGLVQVGYLSEEGLKVIHTIGL